MARVTGDTATARLSTTWMAAWMSTSGQLLSLTLSRFVASQWRSVSGDSSAWLGFASDLTVHAQPQAYTRLADRFYLFENLDGTGFRAELPVDEDGIVLDYPDLFRRVPV